MREISTESSTFMQVSKSPSTRMVTEATKPAWALFFRRINIIYQKQNPHSLWPKESITHCVGPLCFPTSSRFRSTCQWLALQLLTDNKTIEPQIPVAVTAVLRPKVYLMEFYSNTHDVLTKSRDLSPPDSSQGLTPEDRRHVSEAEKLRFACSPRWAVEATFVNGSHGRHHLKLHAVRKKRSIAEFP